jgi:hypothetical protein
MHAGRKHTQFLRLGRASLFCPCLKRCPCRATWFVLQRPQRSVSRSVFSPCGAPLSRSRVTSKPSFEVWNLCYPWSKLTRQQPSISVSNVRVLISVGSVCNCPCNVQARSFWKSCPSTRARTSCLNSSVKTFLPTLARPLAAQTRTGRWQGNTSRKLCRAARTPMPKSSRTIDGSRGTDTRSP